MSRLESLRRQIALIPQDPLLFHRTLRENISYGKPETTEEEMLQAARLAHCDEFISEHSKRVRGKGRGKRNETLRRRTTKDCDRSRDFNQRTHLNFGRGDLVA